MVLFIFVMGCSAQQEKVPFGNRQTNHPTPTYVKDWKEVYERGSYFFFANDILWLLGRDRMVLVNPGYEIKGSPMTGSELPYERFAKDPCSLPARTSKIFARVLSGYLDLSDCTAVPEIYGMTSFSQREVESPRGSGSWERAMWQMKRGALFGDYQHESGFGMVDGRVLVSLNDGLYVFTPKGEFRGRQEREERVTIKNGRIPIGHESALSGPIVVSKTGLSPKMELTFLDRSTRQTKSVLKNVKRFQPDSQTRLREYGHGFYVDALKKVKDKKFYYASDYGPKTWVGKTTIDLRSDDEEFCYVYKKPIAGFGPTKFKETKKCIPNPNGLILEVVERHHAIFVFTYDKVYVKRKEWECLGA